MLKKRPPIEMNRVNAQQSPKDTGSLVGYNLSPCSGGKIRKGMSAGRVRIGALKLSVT
jgi:DNA topoisomerase IA